ncbi:MAG: bifunctional riboflavin kinase/FAD synthetase, partial [Desulfuromonadales bacterium]|nr:bifunctional riboflavin kinase/FAD synthetase [Desulfuromonadales bacterium]
MKIVRSLSRIVPPPGGTVVTIGNFDGVHLGHREIFRRVVGTARTQQAAAAVVTFEPHPLRLLAPDKAPPRINTPVEKVRLIRASCIDLLVILPFTRKLAALSATDFVSDVLVGRLGVRHLVIGYDYAFGRNREGDAAFLAQAAQRHGFTLEVLEPLRAGAEIYSSTSIRKALLRGDVNGVVGVLGRHFTLDGRVIGGEGRGRQLGFPTANLATAKELLPCEGVYAVRVRHGRRLYDGVANLGRRPTFAGVEPSLEIHLLDFAGDLYGARLRIYFVERLRDEQNFPSAAALQAVIRDDIARARAVLAATRVLVYKETFDCGVAS